VWFPKPAWWPLILWVTPAVAVLGMAATVLVSARVSSTVEANQSGSSLMLLVLALVAGQLSGALFLNVTTMWWIGAVVWVVDAVLLRLAVRLFARQELVARL
jgi:ABC-2 type transport system permease protein